MPLFDRPEGVLLRRLPAFQRVFPYVMETRTESAVYHQRDMRIRRTLALLEKLNEGRTQRRLTLFHVVLAALVRVLALRPENNRFVVGRRIYQRKNIELSFVTKKALTEEAAETTVKLAFDPRDTLESVAARVHEAVSATKKSATSSDEKLTGLLAALPRFLLRLVFRAWGILDYFNLLPFAAYRGDSFYASAFLANLGSIGLDAVGHHLYEFGTIPFFVVIGRTRKGLVVGDDGAPAVDDVATLSFTVDERITDGVHLSRTLALLAQLVEDPAKLLEAPTDLPDPFRYA